MPTELLERSESGTSSQEKFGKSNRIELLDFLRGAAIVYVMLYHLLYDLIYFQGIDMPFFHTDLFEVIHKIFVGILIIVSGICSGFSRNTVKRGAELYLMGSILTIFTDIFMHDMVFVFGALSFFGAMMVICGICRPLIDKINCFVLFAAGLLMYIITFDFPNGGVLHLFFTDITIPLPEDAIYSYAIGIKPKGFHSSDYFPLIPNGFLYIMGAALSGIIARGGMPRLFYGRIRVPVINFLGRHSLLFYIIHQPLFMLIMLAF